MKKFLWKLSGWIFVTALLPFIILGSTVAVLFFACYIGFNRTAKTLLSWSEKM